MVTANDLKTAIGQLKNDITSEFTSKTELITNLIKSKEVKLDKLNDKLNEFIATIGSYDTRINKLENDLAKHESQTSVRLTAIEKKVAEVVSSNKNLELKNSALEVKSA